MLEIVFTFMEKKGPNAYMWPNVENIICKCCAEKHKSGTETSLF